MKSGFTLATVLSVLLLSTIAASQGLYSKKAKVTIRAKGSRRSNGLRGAVYAMSNNLTRNTIVAYARTADDDFVFIGEFATGGRGAILDTTDDIDPLLSANSVVVTPSKKFLLNANAGSSSITVFRILPNFRLRRVSIAKVAGTGPLAIAVNSQGVVYVASEDFDGKFNTFVDAVGSLTGFRLTSRGKLIPLRGSVRKLSSRPGDVVFSPDGNSLVVSSFNAFLGELPAPSASLLSYKVFPSGLLSKMPVDTASSTTPGNPPGRDPPILLGIEIVRVRGVQYVVVPEVRGTGTQAGSVSTFRLDGRGILTPVQIDLIIGSSITDGQVAPCWVRFVSTKKYFFITNTGSGSVSSFSFADGKATLLQEVAASGLSSTEGAVDIAISPDDKFLFVHGGKTGDVGVFRILDGGRIELVKDLTALPSGNTQGIAVV